MKNKKKSFISNLMVNQYSGKWHSLNENIDNLNSIKNKNIYLVGYSNDGDPILGFSKAFKMRTKRESIFFYYEKLQNGSMIYFYYYFKSYYNELFMSN